MLKSNKNFQLHINYIEFSNDTDKSLLIIACNLGYRIYHRITFTLLSEVDDFQQLIGSLAKATLYSNSKVICFVGSESNSCFPPSQLIVWDDDRKVKLGLLMLNESIMDFYLGKRLLFINISSKVLLFNFPNLEYIKTIHNIASNKRQLIDIKQNPSKEFQDYVLMAKVGIESFNIINIFQFKSMSNTQKHTETKQNISIKTFDLIKQLYIASSSNMLIVCSNYGNKIHLYSINQNQFTFFICIYLGNNIYEVSNFAFDIKNKYIAFIIESQEIMVYKLCKLKQVCKCKSHTDSIVVKKKQSKGGFFDLIKKSISGITSSYGKYDFNYKDSCLLLFFNSIPKDLLQVINKEGLITQVKMNRKEQGNLRKETAISLFGTTIKGK